MAINLKRLHKILHLKQHIWGDIFARASNLIHSFYSLKKYKLKTSTLGGSVIKFSLEILYFISNGNQKQTDGERGGRVTLSKMFFKRNVENFIYETKSEKRGK